MNPTTAPFASGSAQIDLEQPIGSISVPDVRAANGAGVPWWGLWWLLIIGMGCWLGYYWWQKRQKK